MDIEDRIQSLRDTINLLLGSEMLKIRDFVNEDAPHLPRPNVLEFQGIYVIFEDETPIYVGLAGAKPGRYIKWRIGDSYYNPKSRKIHPLTKKLLEEGRFRNIDEVRGFYLSDNCSFKVIETSSSRETKMLEHLLIGILQPKHND